MNRLLELKQKRAALYDEADAAIKLAEKESRPLTDDETKTIADRRAAMEQINRSIDAEESMASFRTQIEPENQVRDRAPVTVHDNAEDKPWGSFGEQLRAVYDAYRPGGQFDQRLNNRAPSGLGESVGSDGGFLVQKDFSAELLKRTYESGQIAMRCRKIPIGPASNGLKINAIDETSRANGSRFGGVQAYWANEADTVTGTKPKFRDLNLTLKKLFGICYATDELLADATALGAVISDAFSEEFAFKVDDAIVNGTGAGQPLGFRNSGAVVEVAKESGQAAATVVVQNVFKMRSRLWARSRRNSAWLINQDIEPQLHGMRIGTDAGAENVFMPAGGVSNLPYDTLYGRPIIPIEQASTLGTVGDIMLVDLSQYLLIDKGGVNQQSSMHVRFLYDENTFRFILRIDGQPIWNSALTPYKGTATQSPFVTLATRA